MNCRDILHFFSDYLDGFLEDEKRKVFIDHLSSCPDCERVVNRIEKAMEMLSPIGYQEPSSAFNTDLKRKLARQIKREEAEGEGVEESQTLVKKAFKDYVPETGLSRSWVKRFLPGLVGVLVIVGTYFLIVSPSLSRKLGEVLDGTVRFEREGHFEDIEPKGTFPPRGRLLLAEDEKALLSLRGGREIEMKQKGCSFTLSEDDKGRAVEIDFEKGEITVRVQNRGKPVMLWAGEGRFFLDPYRGDIEFNIKELPQRDSQKGEVECYLARGFLLFEGREGRVELDAKRLESKAKELGVQKLNPFLAFRDGRLEETVLKVSKGPGTAKVGREAKKGEIPGKEREKPVGKEKPKEGGLGEVFGMVSLGETKAPLAGEEITIVASDGFQKKAITDFQGVYLFKGVPQQEITFKVGNGSFIFLEGRESLSLRGEERVENNLHLARGCVLKGTVRDQNFGTIIEKATIKVTPMDSGGIEEEGEKTPKASRSVQSDAQGRFELGGLLAGMVRIEVQAKNFSPASKELPLGLGENFLDLELEKGGEIVGVLLDESGEPLKGVTVRLIRGGEEPKEEGRAISGSDGKFSFSGIAAGEEFFVDVDAPAYSRTIYGPFSVSSDEITDLQTEIQVRHGGSVRGEVLNSAGEGLAGLTVEAVWTLGDREFVLTEVRTGEGGSFSLDRLPPAHLSLRLRRRKTGGIEPGEEEIWTIPVGITEEGENDLGTIQLPWD